MEILLHFLSYLRYFVDFASIICLALILFRKIQCIFDKKTYVKVKELSIKNKNTTACRPLNIKMIPKWTWYDTNSSCVFAATESDTVVVFSYDGKEICELVSPKNFKRFSVNDEEITFDCFDTTDIYSFENIKWWNKNNENISLPMNNCGPIDARINRSMTDITIESNGKKKHLRIKKEILYHVIVKAITILLLFYLLLNIIERII